MTPAAQNVQDAQQSIKKDAVDKGVVLMTKIYFIRAMQSGEHRATTIEKMRPDLREGLEETYDSAHTLMKEFGSPEAAITALYKEMLTGMVHSAKAFVDVNRFPKHHLGYKQKEHNA